MPNEPLTTRAQVHYVGRTGMRIAELEFKLAASEARCAALRRENADLKTSVIAFGAPYMVEFAKLMGLPRYHLYPNHYDILKDAGARMDDFTRTEIANAK